MQYFYSILIFSLICLVNARIDDGSSKEARAAMAKSMMSDMIEQQQRMREIEAAGGNAPSRVVDVNSRIDLEAPDDVYQFVLIRAGAQPIDVAKMNAEAERIMRQKSDDKRAVQEFDAVSMKFEADEKIRFVSIDASTDVGKKLAHDFVPDRMFPRVLIFKGSDEFKSYPNDIKVKTMYRFAKLLMAPLLEIENEDKLYDFLWNQTEEAVVIGFLRDGDKFDEDFKVFSDFVDSVRGEFPVYFYRSSEALTRVPRIPAFPTAATFRQFAEPAVFEGIWSARELYGFAMHTAFDWIDQVDKLTFNVYVQQGKPLVVLWLDPSDTPSLPSLITALREAATQFRHSLKFLYADGVKNSKQAAMFGVTEGVLPSVTLLDMTRFVHYVMPVPNGVESITYDALVAFGNSFVNGELEPDVKRQTAPEQNDGPVYTLVYDTFNDFVMDTRYDVLVVFCVPDNENCALLLEPTDGILARLAARDDDALRVAHIDLSENSTPLHGIRSAIYGYPTVKLFAAADKKPVKFEERTISADSLYEFVLTHRENIANRAQKRAQQRPRPNLDALKQRVEERRQKLKEARDDAKDEL